MNIAFQMIDHFLLLQDRLFYHITHADEAGNPVVIKNG